MCWAVPARVIEINDLIAKVDFGGGTVREVLAATPEPLAVGDYVLVHAGTAISRLSEEEFLESFTYYRDIAIQLEVDAGVPRKRAEKEVARSLKGLLGNATRS
ncbi:MAG TPA: HypC/HybG/HupF family hydrogenase formation chaperone [Conexivisphaerales archaeon]|nr:HypC/HybG/HupF family hydrogenase formation chaperone [Conexivisphaerales archaeon]